MIRKSLRAVLAGAVCVAATVAGTAAPSAAGTAKSTSYPATWTFGGGTVTGDLQRYPQLTDYAPEYNDRVAATPATGEAVTVGGKACRDGSYYEAGLSLFADPKNWANLVTGTPNGGARVRIACTGVDGVIHHVHWGSYVEDPKPQPGDAAGVPATNNCVTLTRSDTAEAAIFTLVAGDGCVAQDRTVSRSGKVVDVVNTSLPFTATITVPGLK